MTTGTVEHRIAHAYEVLTAGCLAFIDAEEAESDAPGTPYARMLRRNADRLMQKGEMLQRGVLDEVLGSEGFGDE